MIPISEIIKTETFEKINNSKSQIDFYIENNSHPDILKIVRLNNKSFGEKMQRIITEFFNLNNPTNSGHDCKLPNSNVKVEIKSSRFWVNTKDWRWQHIMVEHDYEYIILIGINFEGIDTYIISKQKFLELYQMGIVTQQGNAEGQGLWCEFSKIKPYLTNISSPEELNKFINT